LAGQLHPWNARSLPSLYLNTFYGHAKKVVRFITLQCKYCASIAEFVIREGVWGLQ
jgi:hypothetical protein